MKKITLSTLNKMKQEGEKFTCLTAYDSTFAHALGAAGVETILVGDSLGMVIQGKESTVPVTVDEMVYHTKCVAQGAQSSLILADMPFMGCATLDDALHNSAALMRAGAHVVKLEGTDWLAEPIYKLAQGGIPVCAHMGLTPQSVNKFGGYKVQGRGEEAGNQLVKDALAVQEAGAAILLVECIPSKLGKRLTETLEIPVIGIGAGPDTDAQVLVMHDMLGVTPGKTAKFVKNFMEETDSIQEAFELYVEEVKSGKFPGPEHGFA